MLKNDGREAAKMRGAALPKEKVVAPYAEMSQAAAVATPRPWRVGVPVAHERPNSARDHYQKAMCQRPLLSSRRAY